MAHRFQPQFDFRYRRVELLKTESLGIGSYGAVCKAMCDDLPCAAKILHPALFQFISPERTSVMRKFEQECRLLSAIKHPRIVQYLGTYHDPESRLPVLLMELMDESLTRFLERSSKPLLYHTEVNFCHDIALALSYLHSNGIVHRDLSSNNVLLIAGSMAKVTDFGMVKLINHSTAHITPLTLCPGTVAYMSPEALRDRPVYTNKLDSFSFGVLCIQIITRMFPAPGDRFKVMEISDPRIPSGKVQVEVPEIERRQSHIDLIDPAHPLLPVALDCLENNDEIRPSCHELCGQISTLKTASRYTVSVQQSQVNIRQHIQDLEQQLHIKDDQLHTMGDQLYTLSTNLHEKEQAILQQQQQILGLRSLLTATNDQLQTLQQQLAAKVHQLEQKEATIAAYQQEIQQLRQQLLSSEQAIVDFQQDLLERATTVQEQQSESQELQQQLRHSSRQRQEEVDTSGAAASRGIIKLRWRDGGKAPSELYGEVAVVDGGVAYVRAWGNNKEILFGYNSTNDTWSELPKPTNYGSSLAMVNGFLTAIGGKTPNHDVTKLLLSLADNQWTKQFPPMPTKRWLIATVCSGSSLVVAGGVGEEKKRLRRVEVMDTETLQWYIASSLPHSLYQATTTLCGEQVYFLGGWDQNKEQSKSVFTCSLAALRQSYQPQSLGERLRTLSLTSRPKVWQQLADTPVTLSTCASLRDRLIAVGGYDSHGKETTAIHMYNTATNSWEVVSQMATPRYLCLVAVLPHNQLMVVGGYTPGGMTDSVEIATIV